MGEHYLPSPLSLEQSLRRESKPDTWPPRSGYPQGCFLEWPKVRSQAEGHEHLPPLVCQCAPAHPCPHPLGQDKVWKGNPSTHSLPSAPVFKLPPLSPNSTPAPRTPFHTH